uniref:LIM and cysteine-rich domains 1 n=1 Tax=Sinocyclocheilus anshuiensis TaxID=1608454 RepID=A0A671KCW9_9TELE
MSLQAIASGKGAACLTCKGSCSGFQPHSWRRPVAGTAGSLYHHKQLIRQLPYYDQGWAVELKAMAQFVKSYEESLGVGDAALPGEKCSAKTTTNGTAQPPLSNKSEYRCSGCGQLAAMDRPVVYANRAGYTRLWHPSCFVCCECGEALVDLIYFWKEGVLLCGRHYCQSIRPRCLGCDELIFSEMFHQEANGHFWHKEHFCCWLCGQNLRVQCACDKRQSK